MRFLVFVVAFHAVGCGATPSPSAPESLQPPRELTILYTADEHGWLAAKKDAYAHLGGASQFLSALIDHEHHCPGSLDRGGVAIHPRRDHCPSKTLLLSGGDNFTGPALSTQLRGQPVADTMRVLGYSAAAFGNHELDFGREAFLSNRERSGVRYLAANMVHEDGSASDLAEPYAIFERDGIRIGVIGIATEKTLEVGMRKRFEGLHFESVEATLDRTVPRVWAEGSDAVIVIAHECHDVLAPIFLRHPEWKIAFVGTGHCHRSAAIRAGETLLLGPAWGLSHYGRAKLRFHPEKPQRERAELVDWQLIDVNTPLEKPAASGDFAFDVALAGWQAQVDHELGERIGHSRGFSAASETMPRWVLGAWLDAYPQADFALTTRGALRQDMPAGPVTLATVQSILPFDNDLVVLKLPREEVAALASRAKSLVAGLRCEKNACTKSDGTELPPMVTLVTTDFLYFGGDGYALEKYDASPTMTKVGWREPVLAWTRRAASTTDAPLETKLEKTR